MKPKRKKSLLLLLSLTLAGVLLVAAGESLAQSYAGADTVQYRGMVKFLSPKNRLDLPAQMRFFEATNSAGNEYVGWRAPFNMSASYTLIWPAVAPTTGQILQAASSDSVVWGSAGAGDITGVVAGVGLADGGLSGDVTLNVIYAATAGNADTLTLHDFVTGTPSANTFIKWNGANWVTAAAGGTIIGREVDGSPSVAALSTLEFLQSTGLKFTDQGSNVGRVEIDTSTVWINTKTEIATQIASAIAAYQQDSDTTGFDASKTWVLAKNYLVAADIAAKQDDADTLTWDATKTYVNSRGFLTTETGDISAVTAGYGLAGGGSSGAVTLTVDSTTVYLQTKTENNALYVPLGRTITAGNGLVGGSSLNANITLDAIGSDGIKADTDTLRAILTSTAGMLIKAGVGAIDSLELKLDGSTLSKSTAGVKVSAIGSAEIINGAILNEDINASAAIALSKIASSNAGRLVITSGGTLAERAALTASALTVGDATNGVASLALGSANRVVGMNSGGTANEYKDVLGTSNRVTVTHGANSITLNAPQDLHTAALNQFSRTLLDSLRFTNTGGIWQNSDTLRFLRKSDGLFQFKLDLGDLPATGEFMRVAAGRIVNFGAIADADVPNTITLDNVTQITTRNLSDMQGQITDTQIADGAVDGGTGGEIADNTLTAADIDETVAYNFSNAGNIFTGTKAVLDSIRFAGVNKISANNDTLYFYRKSDGAFQFKLFLGDVPATDEVLKIGAGRIASWQADAVSGGAGGYSTVQEEGSGLTQRATLNFVGSSATAADDAGNTRTNVTFDADLNALASNSTDGLWAHTGAARTLTGTGGAVSITNGDGVSGNPTFTLPGTLTVPTVYAIGSDPADAEVIRLENNAKIAWEASPASTDLTLGIDASEILQSSANFNAPVLTENTNAVPNATDHLGFFAATTSAQLFGIISDETGGTGVLVGNISPTISTSLSQDGDVADAGYLRLQNAAIIGWEAAPTGTDVTLTVDASEVMQASGTFNAVTLTENGNGITNNGDALGGDLSGNLPNPSVTDDSHAHTTTTISGLDVSSDLNLVAGTNITLTGDQLDVDDVFVLNSGDAITGNLDFNDGVTDSPQAIFTPATGTAWKFYTVDSDDDLTIESASSGSTENIDITNPGAGTATLTVEGAISASNFSGSSSGANTGDQTITLTSHVTGSGTGSFATTIANSVITAAMMANGDHGAFTYASNVAALDAGTVSGGNAGVISDNTITADDVAADAIGASELLESADFAITGSMTFDADALHIFDTNASHDLIITPGSDLTADRVLTITTGDAARTLTMTGNATVSGTNTGDITVTGENYLSLSSQQITANAVNLSGTHVTGTLAAARFPALTGDVTTTAGSVATAIGADKVTEAMLKAVNAAVDEDIFTYEATTGDFEWHTLAELNIQPLEATLTDIADGTIDENLVNTANPWAVNEGGTGAATFTANGVLYGNTTSALQVTAQGSANTVLTANAGAPSFSGQPTLATGIITKGQGAVQIDPYGSSAGNTGEARFLELAANGTNYGGWRGHDAYASSVVYRVPRKEGASTGYVLHYSSTGDSTYWDTDDGAGGGAPTDAQYLTLALNGSLSAERVAVGATNNISLNDAGANGNLTIGLASTLDFAAKVVINDTILVAEGATANGFETHFTIDDPTADREINWPDADGEVTVLGNSSTGTGGVVREGSPSITAPSIADLTNMNHTHQGVTSGGYFVGNSFIRTQNNTDAASNQVAQFQSGDRATAADDDEGYLSFYNDNDGGTQTEFSRLSWLATDVTAATKDAAFTFDIMSANSLTEVLRIQSSAAGTITVNVPNGTLQQGGTAVTLQDRTITVAGTTNEITSSAGAQDLSANRTWTLSLPATIDLGGKTSFEIPNAAAPTTDAFGEIAGDDNAYTTGRGAAQFYDGTTSTWLVGFPTTETKTDGYIPKYIAATGRWRLAPDSTAAGGGTAWDAIGDAAGLGSVSFAGFDQDITSAEDGGDILTITNSDADRASDSNILVLADNDGGDANAFYLRMIGDADGTPTNDYLFSQTSFSVGAGIAATFASASSLTLPTSGGVAPTADGSVAYDNTADRHMAGGAGGVTGSVPRVLAVGHPAESKTNSTASDQDYTSLFTIPASYLIENRVIRVTIGFQYTTGTSSVTVINYLKLGSTKVFTNAASNIQDGVTRSGSMVLTIYGTAAAGASVNVETMLSVGGTINSSNIATSNQLNNTTQPVALATNGTLAITPGVTYSGTGSTETFVLRTYLVEELN